MKKCKYHCEYGDGENCHYKNKNGCIYNEDIVDKVDQALKKFYGFYQPTCRTEEDIRCDNMNK